MTPVLESGLAVYDRSILSPDEFELRIASVQRCLIEHDLAALMIFDSIEHSAGPMAYLAGCCLGGVLLVFPQAAPILITVGAPRELHHHRTLSWMSDVRGAPGTHGQLAAQALAESGVSAGRIATVAMDVLTTAEHAELCTALQRFELVEFDSTYWALRTCRRPRELMAIRRSLSIAAQAAAAAENIYRSGASNAEAVIEAERVGRYLGARDLRLLGNVRDGAMSPMEGHRRQRYDRLIVQVGADQGYYAASTANAEASQRDGAAARALERMVEVARTHATSDAVARAACCALPAGAWQQARAFGLGVECGMTVADTRPIALGDQRGLPEGCVLSLQVLCSDRSGRLELATATVRVGPSGGQRLLPL